MSSSQVGVGREGEEGNTVSHSLHTQSCPAQAAPSARLPRVPISKLPSGPRHHLDLRVSPFVLVDGTWDAVPGTMAPCPLAVSRCTHEKNG